MSAINHLTVSLFNLSDRFELSSVAAIVPDVPKKFIRNITDRELIRLVGSSDPRRYTLRNAVELVGIHLGSTGGSSLAVGQLIGAAMAGRAEQRIRDSVIGTDRDIRVMVYRLTAEKLRPGEGTREKQSISVWFGAFEDVPPKLQDLWAFEPGEVRALPADEIIEAIVARYKSWEAST